MKKTVYIAGILVSLVVASGLPLYAIDPIVTNITAAQRVGSSAVDIYYDLYDTGSTNTMVLVTVSTNNGVSFDIPASHVSGNGYGHGVMPGTNLHIVWEAGADIPGAYIPQAQVNVRVIDGVEGMVLIPAGSFDMGNCMDPDEGNVNELPVHSVYVSSFYIDKYEVTRSMWNDVAVWATANGYSFYDWPAQSSDHPMDFITWHCMVKWCNARSEKEGKTPCYYLGATKTTVFKTGQIDIANDWVKWEADGYRLPTEAEWEKAARGGAIGHRFPWADADTITHSRANYNSSSDYSYDVSPTRGYHPDYTDGIWVYPSPVGSFAQNGYGLYDMAGNVSEWCWDWYSSNYYSTGSVRNPLGPESGMYRVLRDGNCYANAYNARCADRKALEPYTATSFLGFRCVCR